MAMMSRTRPSAGKETAGRSSRIPSDVEAKPSCSNEAPTETHHVAPLASSRKAQVEEATAAKTEQLTSALLAALEAVKSGQCDGNKLSNIEATLQNAVSSVRSLKNLASPVQRLLPETLAHIFSLVQPTYSNTFPSQKYMPEMHQWRNVALVCRYWRDTALAYPFLWTSIHSFSRRQMRTCLQRSRSALIDVYMTSSNFRRCPAIDDVQILDELQAQSNRLREFHLRTLCSHDLQSNVFNYLTAPAPHLESLTIALDEDDQPVSSELPLIFGGGHLPSLKRLNIRHFNTWPHNSFSDLTHLCLHRQAESSRVSLDTFLDLIESCPRLETLALIDAGPVVSDVIAATDASRVIDLPHLKSIDIGHWPTAYTAGKLLSYFNFPSSTVVAVWSTSGVLSSDETLSTLFPPESCHKRHLMSNGIRQMRMTDCRSCPFVLTTGSTLQVNGCARPSQTLLVLSDLCAVDQIDELWLGECCGYDISESDWKTIFRSMEGLETLVIARRPSEPILSALTACTDDKVLCPNLKTIVINAYAATSVSTFFLSVLIQQRKVRGTPLQQLDVTAYDASSSLTREIEYMKVLGVSDVKFGTDYEGMKSKELVEDWPTKAFTWSKADNM